MNTMVISNRMILESLNESIDDFPEVFRKVYRYAKRKHDDTKAVRKWSGNPYWEHPEGVAKIALAYGGNEDEVTAAALHDTMEDAGVVFDDIAEKFGQNVAELVAALTNNRDKIAKLGKEKYMTDKLLTIPESALFVKLADMVYNILDHASESQLVRMMNNLMELSKRRKIRSKKCQAILEDALDTAVSKFEAYQQR